MNPSLDQARAVSDAVSAAVFDAIPVPMVRESCSEVVWRLFDEAQAALDKVHGKAQARRFTGEPPTGFGQLQEQA